VHVNPPPAQPKLVGDVPSEQFRAQLATGGVGVRIGSFDVHITASVAGLAEPLQRLYRNYPALERERTFSFHVKVQDAWHFAPWPQRRVRFMVDGRQPHADMPAGQALCVLEWGINLVIALRYHCYLMLHAAVLERHGYALLMPAAPGSGKTTLCAALAHRGWRLFSDEFGLVRPGTTQLIPVPRPMPLKNESIDVIRAFVPDAELGPVIPNTRKGTIAHVRPPVASIERAQELAPAKWLIFPQWVADCEQSLQEIPKAEGFMLLATNAFNYEMLGETGFETVRGLIEGVRCYRLTYSDLATAVAALNALADSDAC
jgi:HprK-related kinase A